MKKIKPENLLLFDSEAEAQANGFSPDEHENNGNSFGQDEEIVNFNTAVSRHIQKALNATNGKIEGKGGAAELLELNPSTLKAKMRKLGIQRKRK